MTITLIPLRAYLELARPANVVTAWADIMAGVAAVIGVAANNEFQGEIGWVLTEIQSWELEGALGWLLLATTGLYAGGVVMNDVFDAKLDAIERPERAIPSGRASVKGATVFGLILLAVGMVAAFQVGMIAGAIAVVVGLLAVLYDRFSKHHSLIGPINMGLCRAGNLALGMSAIPLVLTVIWPLCLLPLVYIGAITAISQGEVHGGSKKTGSIAVGLVLAILIALIGLFAVDLPRLFSAIGFIVLFAWLVLPSFIKAARSPEASNVRRAVGAGIMALIPLNAAIAAGSAGWAIGIIVLLLMPISFLLARLFAVT